MGFPEGFEPPMHCPNSGCRSHAKECERIRRALEPENSTLTMKMPMTGCKEEAIVHYVDADVWRRCCIKTKKDGWGNEIEGQEKCRCVLMYEKPMPPLPAVPKAAPKGILKKLVGALKSMLKFRAMCGGSLCGSTGEYPPPVCLEGTFGGLALFSKKCIWQGKNNEMHSMHPLKGEEKYTVYQMTSLPPVIATLAARTP